MLILRQLKSVLRLRFVDIVQNQQRVNECKQFSWFTKMQNIKSMRNAQTQHGDSTTVDVENIFLHRNMLSTNSILGTNINDQQQAAESVWFPDDNVTDHNHKSVPPILLSEEKTEEPQLPEKRKANNSDDESNVKKIKLDANGLKTKRPGFSEDRFEETSYYFENGLRKVYPYFFTFTTFAKGRWVDEKILDVFVREFRAAPPEEYERSLEAGKLTVNNEKVPKDYKIKHNDLLANVVHRHEVPVTSQPIKIVYMDKDIVVVNKPASIPVHPCGRYRHNTVVFILAKEHNMKNLRTIHRLDRLTSGLLLFGRTSERARELELQIRTRQVHKEYVCRVEGRFPDGIVECHEKIDVVSYKIGVCKVSPKGKDCKTTFQRIGEVGDDSIVLCKPLTGRMHQIRVHLQFLGYPISNDPLYNHEVFGPLKGRGGDIGGITEDQLIKNLISIHNAENWLGLEGEQIATRESNVDLKITSKVEVVNDPEAMTGSLTTNESNNDAATQTCYEEPDRSFDSKKTTSDPHCPECKVNYRDPGPKDLIMFLHAWKYKGVGWEYQTELPEWACKSDIDYDQL
ncbi:LOW QUALITY PROTEIN: RNA pseudouridylate synthase domain-containing protein 2 [Drosophila eugracilis]|uniref:LOW QUALITY PROTEIN: RNA pseudouridylate synthase domain-containing protein 2 n=1 Tax=Drosophila eugracilis TaxID=29029 RepID=UPI001BD9E316|nr:LOW QUALITY PROTEIN: RNA pseudouridylate synthase domain-containing protein 2 [Drosophila eugracilis]